jgi:hypothetical protein
MGCQHSTPEKKLINIGKSELSKPRGVGHTERLISAELKRLQASGHRGATVSLEADEEITDEMPKLDESGQLMGEEVVRRTSLSLNVSNITIGSKEKGGKTVQVQVSKEFYNVIYGPCRFISYFLS